MPRRLSLALLSLGLLLGLSSLGAGAAVFVGLGRVRPALVAWVERDEASGADASALYGHSIVLLNASRAVLGAFDALRLALAGLLVALGLVSVVGAFAHLEGARRSAGPARPVAD